MAKGKVDYDAQSKLTTFVDDDTGLKLIGSKKVLGYFIPLDFPSIALSSDIVNLLAQASEEKSLGLHDIKGTLIYQEQIKPALIESINISIEGHNPNVDDQTLKKIQEEIINASTVLATLQPEIQVNIEFCWEQTDQPCCKAAKK